MTKNYNDLGVEFKYLIVNDMDQKFGLWVNTVGFQSIQPNSNCLFPILRYKVPPYDIGVPLSFLRETMQTIELTELQNNGEE